MNDLKPNKERNLNSEKVSQSDQIEKRKTKVEINTIEYARYTNP